MVVLQVKEVKGLWQKCKGQIGKRRPEALLFKTRFGIHTFGMKFPIDIIVLDKNRRIVECKENLLPNKFFFWNPLYNNLLELPKGTIKQQGLRKGIIIKIRGC